MTAPTKIAVAVSNDLATWQKLNVSCFLSSGLGTADPSLVGEAYIDADGSSYTPMLAHPVRVFSGDANSLSRSLQRALARGLVVAVYTLDMFVTMNDDDNRAAVSSLATTELDLAGIAIAGNPKQVDKAFDKLRAHE